MGRRFTIYSIFLHHFFLGGGIKSLDIKYYFLIKKESNLIFKKNQEIEFLILKTILISRNQSFFYKKKCLFISKKGFLNIKNKGCFFVIKNNFLISKYKIDDIFISIIKYIHIKLSIF